MSKCNLIYIGSPAFSAQILESIIKSDLVNVVGVVSQPDKLQGRKQVLTASPVAEVAERYNLPTYKPSKLDEANLLHLGLLKPDIFLVVSYGKMIPKTYLALPKIGTFNIHFSLLPKYRGALCISEAIKNQDTKTGVTLMEMDEKLDSGAIIYQRDVSIDIDDNVATLTTKLTQAAMQLLADKLPEICAQTYQKKDQIEEDSTYTPSHRSLTRNSSFIPFEIIERSMSGIDAKSTHALVRSLNPEPGAWTTVKDKELKIIDTSLEEEKLVVITVQLSGKSPISWKQFIQGYLK